MNPRFSFLFVILAACNNTNQVVAESDAPCIEAVQPVEIAPETAPVQELVLEPANTQLLLDYMTGKKPARRFVRPIIGDSPSCDTMFEVVHIVDRVCYTLYFCEDSIDSHRRLTIYVRPLDRRAGGTPDYIGLPSGVLAYSSNEGDYAYHACPPGFDEPCYRENYQDYPIRHAEWVETTNRLIAYYEGR